MRRVKFASDDLPEADLTAHVTRVQRGGGRSGKKRGGQRCPPFLPVSPPQIAVGQGVQFQPHGFHRLNASSKLGVLSFVQHGPPSPPKSPVSGSAVPPDWLFAVLVKRRQFSRRGLLSSSFQRALLPGLRSPIALCMQPTTVPPSTERDALKLQKKSVRMKGASLGSGWSGLCRQAGLCVKLELAHCK